MRSMFPLPTTRSPAVPSHDRASTPASRVWPRWAGRGFVPSLRLLLAVSLGVLGIAATWTLAGLVSRQATARLEAEVGTQLEVLAGYTARSLDLGLFERWGDMQVAASLDTLRDAAVAPEAKRFVLERLHQTYPAYSIISLVSPEGRILVTSNRLLEGADVSRRDYFLAGRERPFVGDVHEAALLAKLLPTATGEPLRLIDLATPIRTTDGTLVGVLIAHLDWAWARETAQSLTRALKGRREGAEVLVLAKDDTVLLGPPALQGRPLPSGLLTKGRAVGEAIRVGAWPDRADDYVSSVADTKGYRDYPGLGWRVVVRQSASRALAPARDLRWDILLTGSLVAFGAALLAWLLSGRIAYPLQDLARAASALGRNEPLPTLPRSIVKEGRVVAEALSATAAALQRRDEARRLLVDELNHRVKNTLATVQSIAAQSLKGLGEGAALGRQIFEARLFALSGAHDVLTRESWSSAELSEVAAQVLRPFTRDGRPCFVLEGPQVRLAPQTALSLTMILHELCTNAAKYGALSAEGGRVAITWALERHIADEMLLRVTWQELDGPAVTPPSRRGSGSRLIERGLEGRHGGEIALDYRPSGLVCTMTTWLADTREEETLAESTPAGPVAAPSPIPVLAPRPALAA